MARTSMPRPRGAVVPCSSGADPPPTGKEVTLSDSVAVDAKRILLRYGAPIGVLDQIREEDRIAFARAVSRTPVPERSERLLALLVEHGYVDAEVARASGRRTRKSPRQNRKPA